MLASRSRDDRQTARTTLRTAVVPMRTAASLIVVISSIGPQCAELARRSTRVASTWSFDTTAEIREMLTSGSSASVMTLPAMAGSIGIAVSFWVQSPDSIQADQDAHVSIAGMFSGRARRRPSREADRR